jgi:hypothetical protein
MADCRAQESLLCSGAGSGLGQSASCDAEEAFVWRCEWESDVSGILCARSSPFGSFSRCSIQVQIMENFINITV